MNNNFEYQNYLELKKFNIPTLDDTNFDFQWMFSIVPRRERWLKIKISRHCIEGIENFIFEIKKIKSYWVWENTETCKIEIIPKTNFASCRKTEAGFLGGAWLLAKSKVRSDYREVLIKNRVISIYSGL